MGLTCASLHLFSPDLSTGASTTSLGPLAETATGPLGYERCESAAEAERCLLVAVAPPWISVFDASNPGAVTEELVDLGKRFSAASHCPVLLTSVLDSDAFVFLLFQEGKQVDGHASARGVLPGKIKKWPLERRAQEWSRLFGRTIDAEEVLALTERKELFADDLLLLLCDLVGLSRRLATSTPGDLQGRPQPNQQEFFFCSRPGRAGGQRVKQTVAYKGPSLHLPIPLGGVAPISFELNGPAGSFTDPVLEFSGPAVDRGLVALSDANYGAYGLWAPGLEAIRAGDIRTIHAVVNSDGTENRRVLRTCLRGLSAERFAFPPRKSSILSFLCSLHGVVVGSGELQALCFPNGAAAESLSLRPMFLVDVQAEEQDRGASG
jgi:hypothetical protein